MVRIPLNLKYRGDRDYLHGTDLFNAFLSNTDPKSKIRMRVYRPMRRQLEMATMESLDKEEKENISAVFECTSPAGDEVWCALENPDLEIGGRYAVDERDIVLGATYTDGALIQYEYTPFTIIERVVAMNKVLLTHQNGNRQLKWWFTRIDLKRIPDDSSPLTLKPKSSLGTKLVASSISCNDEQLGTVYFTEVAAA